jgi:tetratricopeptide (TPR) repeat protein
MFARIALIQGRSGDKEGALKSLKIALNSADSLTDIGSRVDALVRVATAQADAGNADKASEILQRALELSNTAENEPFRDIVFPKIAVAYGKIGNLVKAIKLTEQIHENWARAITVGKIAAAIDGPARQ